MGKTTHIKSKSFEGEPRQSAEYVKDQKNPMWRREVKKLIESGLERNAARAAAREVVKAKMVKLTMPTDRKDKASEE